MLSLQHQDTGSIPSPAQWVKGSGVTIVMVWVTTAAQISLAQELHMLQGSQKRKKKKSRHPKSFRNRSLPILTGSPSRRKTSSLASHLVGRSLGSLKRRNDPNHSLSLALPEGRWPKVAEGHHTQCQLRMLPTGVTPAPLLGQDNPSQWSLHTFWSIRKLFRCLQCADTVTNTGATAVTQSRQGALPISADQCQEACQNRESSQPGTQQEMDGWRRKEK